MNAFEKFLYKRDMGRGYMNIESLERSKQNFEEALKSLEALKTKERSQLKVFQLNEKLIQDYELSLLSDLSSIYFKHLSMDYLQKA